MARILRFGIAFLSIVGLAAIDGSALAQPKDKGKDRKEQTEGKGKKDGKENKVKGHKHQNGKDLLGDKLKKDGKHTLQQHGKATAYVDVKGGKIAGVSVTHAEKGNVPVTKYKSSKKMAEGPSIGNEPGSLVRVQVESIGTLWIGYGFIDDYGYEIIYWFPYDMIYDGDTGAIEYIAIE